MSIIQPKLTPEAVRYIKQVYRAGCRIYRGQRAPKRLISNMPARVEHWFGIKVSVPTIKAIVYGKRWRHVR